MSANLVFGKLMESPMVLPRDNEYKRLPAGINLRFMGVDHKTIKDWSS
jgi:hypothetical protein